MASGVVDICLIPEVPFLLDGPHGMLAYLETVLAQRGHVVICMAEGAAQVTQRPYPPECPFARKQASEGGRAVFQGVSR